MFPDLEEIFVRVPPPPSRVHHPRQSMHSCIDGRDLDWTVGAVYQCWFRSGVQVNFTVSLLQESWEPDVCVGSERAVRVLQRLKHCCCQGAFSLGGGVALASCRVLEAHSLL